LAIVSNGTIAIQMAIKALELKGEIITTPFTWLATVSAIKWENCVPVFCDIHPETLNIDVKKLEEKITPNTVAIMPVHVFGNPCDVYAIEAIAKKHNLKVIYDAAHSFGVTYKN
jgi:dTDP-4-amino-4,6-dideoxygalactose transaminase